MPASANGNNDAEAKTKSRKPRSQNNKIFKREVALIDYIITACVVILGVIDGGLFTYAYTAIGLEVLLAIFLLVALGLALHVRHHFLGKKIISFGLIVLFLFPAAILIARASFKLDLELSNKPERFVVARGPIISQNVSNKDEGVGPLFSRVFLTGEMAFISNISFLVFLSIKNVQTVGTVITGISAESSMSEDGPWTKLCRVDLRTGTLVDATGDGATVRALADDFKLDFNLTERTIAPGNLVSGWEAYACPDQTPCTMNFLRLTILDMGEPSRIVIPNMSISNNNLMLSAFQNTPNTFDLSKYKIIVNHQCSE